MKKSPIIIVAVDCDGGFGKDGKIPWHLPEDLKHFKKITDGHICVMGKRTYLDLLDARLIRDKQKGEEQEIDQILRGRDSYVVTSNTELPMPGVTKVRSIGDVYTKIAQDDPRDVFVIGGRRMFIEALSSAHKIHMTVLKGNSYKCDVHFPVDVLNKKWKIVSGEETDKAYFVVYNRI